MPTQYALDLIKSPQSVFSTDQLALLWQETTRSKVQDRARYYLKNELLYPIRKGFYAKGDNYNKLEFAIKLYTPAYISLETVLAREGIINQYYESIFVVSYLSKEIEIDGQNYIYKKIKDIALNNHKGVNYKNNVWIASKERALLDTIYLYPDYHFDNLLSIDWEQAFELAEIYRSKAVLQRLKKYHREYA